MRHVRKVSVLESNQDRIYPRYTSWINMQGDRYKHSYKQAQKLNHMIISINTKRKQWSLRTVFSSKTIQLKQWDTYTQNIKSRHISTFFTKTNSKWIRDLKNMKNAKL